MTVFNFLSSMGASIILPIFLTIFGLVFRQGFGKSLRSGLMVGISLTGINIVVNYFFGVLSPIVDVIAKQTGTNMSVMDVGWGALSSIAWSSVLAPAILIVGLVVNIILIVLNATKTLNLDIWNYWGAYLFGQIAYLRTGSYIIGLAVGTVTMIIVLLLADRTQPLVEDYFGMPNVSISHFSALSAWLIAWPVNNILDRIPGIEKMNWSTEHVQKRIGIIGEPVFIGAIIGALLGAISGMGASAILTAALATSATLILLPKIVGILMEGIVPLSEGIGEYMKTRFKDKEIFIGMDAAILVGDPATIVTGVLLIPITLLLAVILPGNTVLPLADLVAVIYPIALIAGLTKGNMLKNLICGTVFVVFNIYAAGAISTYLTASAVEVGYEIGQGISGITSLGAGAGLIPYVVQEVFVYIASLFGF